MFFSSRIWRQCKWSDLSGMPSTSFDESWINLRRRIIHLYFHRSWDLFWSVFIIYIANLTVTLCIEWSQRDDSSHPKLENRKQSDLWQIICHSNDHSDRWTHCQRCFWCAKLDSDHSKSSSPSFNNTHTNYLYVSIAEPLSHALSYVIIYRPDDAIELIASTSNFSFFPNLSTMITKENIFLGDIHLRLIGNRLLPIAW